MKSRFPIALLFCIVWSGLAGQPTENLQIGEILLLDSGGLKKLERQVIQKRPNFFYFEKLESQTQTVAKPTIEMIVRVWDDRLDPIASVRLYKVKQNNLFKCRTVPVIKTKTSGKSTSNVDFEGLSRRVRPGTMDASGKMTPGPKNSSYNALSLINYDKLKRIYFTSEKYQPGLLKISLKNLKPGSYAIKVQNDERAWNLFDVIEDE